MKKQKITSEDMLRASESPIKIDLLGFPMKKLSVEIVTERILPGPRGIIMSTFRDATEKDIEAAKEAHKKDNPHDDEKTTVFYDKEAYMYDHRCCGICHEIIALI